MNSLLNYLKYLNINVPTALHTQKKECLLKCFEPLVMGRDASRSQGAHRLDDDVRAKEHCLNYVWDRHLAPFAVHIVPIEIGKAFFPCIVCNDRVCLAALCSFT